MSSITQTNIVGRVSYVCVLAQGAQWPPHARHLLLSKNMEQEPKTVVYRRIHVKFVVFNFYNS